MLLTLDSKIEDVVGVGPKMAAKLKKLGIETVYDLILDYPRKYQDFTRITPIAKIQEAVRNGSDEFFSIKGAILAIANKKTKRRGFIVTEAVMADETGTIKVVWFNQPYLSRMLQAGYGVILNGKVAFDAFSAGYVMESPTRTSRPIILPIYSETQGISSFYLSKLYQKIKVVIAEICEYLPPAILKQYRLLPLQEALLNIHEPKNSEILESAKRRIAFDELFLIVLRGKLNRLKAGEQKAPEIKFDLIELKKSVDNLPYELTSDQKKVLDQILADIQKDAPMRRLLNGDVGTGKTIVALLASYATVMAGYKVLLMCPTEILASQHFLTFEKILSGQNLQLGLLTSNRKEIINCQSSNTDEFPKDQIRKNEESNDNWKMEIRNCNLLIGTHALLNLDIDNVGLVIVDEQHRFGVNQRQTLQDLSISKSRKVVPHFLSMTATPIPRTLHLALFGDLDISVINEKPKNRKEIKTRLVESYNRDKAYDFIARHIEAGRQAFIICPLIEDKSISDSTNLQLFEQQKKTVVDETAKLKKFFPKLSIAMLHGRMKSVEKNQIMADFMERKIDMLVSTSVIEVGIDVPNATIMMIEDADRFGLAQIHQFRGRVGRGEHQSFCFLFSDTLSDKAARRLKGLESISDGFRLAELDLEMRGPGSIFGTEQSGMLDLKMASISDKILIEEATRAGQEIAQEIDKYPKLFKKINEYSDTKHLE